jgi:phospholipid/cholesterol/gamma-HCH transport system permease protein
MAMLERIGRAIRLRLHELLYALGFFYSVLRESILFFRRRQVGFKVLVMQILFTGYEALRITAVLAIALGVAINFIGASLLSTFGQGKLAYTFLIIVITRELGPLLTAFVVIARSGTAIATELGGMVVNHEIEAYVSVGVNPLSYLAAPRFLGVVISMMVLNVYFNVFGLLGSFAVMQVLHPLGMEEYFRNLFSVLTVTDLLSGFLKSLVFGVIISTVSIYRGLRVEYASTEIPVAGIKAVSSCFMLCVGADAVITAIQYLG